jgi:hypothetical protein
MGWRWETMRLYEVREGGGAGATLEDGSEVKVIGRVFIVIYG